MKNKKELVAKFGNEFVGVLSEQEKKKIIEQAAVHIQEALNLMYIDTKNDHNTKKTAYRVAKMWVTEKMKGRFSPKPKITTFPNHKQLNQMLVVGPITVKSMCSHHFVDFTGHCYIGLLTSPDGVVMGLSKYARLVDWIARRPQIQEELTVQVADELEELLKPEGLGVLIEAQHFCCSNRGAEQTDMKFATHEIRGTFRDDPRVKSEFFNIVQSLKQGK